MAKYGYLKCKCSNPAEDYIESHEIFDVDKTGFTIGLRRKTKYFYKEEPVLDGLADEMINETKEWYDKYRPNLDYPTWFDHEKYFKTKTEGNDTYVVLLLPESDAVILCSQQE